MGKSRKPLQSFGIMCAYLLDVAVLVIGNLLARPLFQRGKTRQE
jgi:hypothetical protein